jgi:hypothetical protein
MRLFTINLIVFLFVTSAILANFSEKMTVDNTELTHEEIRKLTNDVGLNSNEIENMPVKILKSLLADHAKKLAGGGKIFTSRENHPFLRTQKQDIIITGTAFSVGSDRRGYKKIYLYGNFEWMIIPVWTLVDKMSIGYPVTTDWFLPFKNGNVAQHWNNLCYKKFGSSGEYKCTESTKVSDWDPGIGVAAAFDLPSTPSRLKMKGAIGQYVYVKNTKSGTVNIKFRYGHQLYSGVPRVGIYPFGLSVTPTLSTETFDYGIEFSY